MENTETYLKWCLKQQRGIRLVKPSENLVNAYLEKSRNALRSMEVNAKESIIEWAVSASYYAKYFAVYALLSRVGIRCEIHDCTIALFEHLFGNSVDSQLINEFRKSKKDRIETQYYTRKVNVELDQLMRKTKNFVLEIEKILDDMNNEKTGQLQSVLNKLKIND